MEEERLLFIGADAMEYRTGDHGEVFIRLHGLGNHLNLAPGLGVVLNLTADEADRMGEALRRMAASARAQSGKPRGSS
jgi:hypothetical protein